MNEPVSINKKVGKIARATFGWGGYQDVMFGLSLTFSSQSWGCGHFDGQWGMDPSPDAQWTKESRCIQWGELVGRVAKLLKDAKVTDVSELVGVPVEVTFDGMRFQSFRILTEAL